MKKLKPLLPSLREKKRYIAFELLSKKIIDTNILFKHISENYIQMHGVLNLAHSGIIPLFETFSNNRGILRVSHRHVDDLRASFAFMNTIVDEQVILRSLGVSGMLNKAKKYLAK